MQLLRWTLILNPIVDLEFGIQMRQTILLVQKMNWSRVVCFLGITLRSEEIEGCQIDKVQVGMQLGHIKVPCKKGSYVMLLLISFLSRLTSGVHVGQHSQGQHEIGRLEGIPQIPH